MSEKSLARPTPPTNLTYKPFPTQALPPGLRSFITGGARAIGCDPVSLALPALCTAAGIIGGSRRLQVKTSWLAPPILWGCLLGESGTSKSPALRLVLAPLRNHERSANLKNEKAARDQLLRGKAAPGNAGWHGIRYSEGHGDKPRFSAEGRERTALAIGWRGRTASAEAPGNPPPASSRRILISDTTTEALACIAKENPHGLLLARDELAGFFGDLDRFGGGDEAFFLSAYDGEQVTVDRKTAREHIFVPQLALSIIGTCQPAVFEYLMKPLRRESGLLARFLLVEPPIETKDWPAADLDPQTEANWKNTIDHLLTLPNSLDDNNAPVPWTLQIEEEAHTLYRDFYRTHNAAAAKETGHWRAFLSKAEQLPLRLALILHHLHWAESKTLTVSRDATQSALPTSEKNSPIPTRSVSEELPPIPIPTRSVSEVPPSPIPTRSVSEAPTAALQPDSLLIPTETMQNAITLTHWFIHEASRVYFLLSATPEERLALELEAWITTQGGKTTLSKLMNEAPQKFRQSEREASALLKTLSTMKRGEWRYTILPINITTHTPSGPSASEFHLKKAA